LREKDPDRWAREIEKLYEVNKRKEAKEKKTKRRT